MEQLLSDGNNVDIISPEFDVALSFAGEDRNYVQRVAEELKKMDVKVYYDNYEEINSWGKDLYDYLDEIYRTKAQYTVIFISKFYADKLWTNHERKSAQARAFTANEEYILPVRFDDTPIKGILPTTAYLNIKNVSPEELADKINKKIGSIPKEEFLPTNIDRLYSTLHIKSVRQKRIIRTVLDDLMDNLKLMTKKERILLWQALENHCEEGKPENIHLSIENYQRITGLSKEEIIKIFSRLNYMFIESRLRTSKHKYSKDRIAPEEIERIEIRFIPAITVNVSDKIIDPGNSTYILYGIFDCLRDNYCPDCAKGYFTRLDLSVLNKYAFSEKEVKEGRGIITNAITEKV